MSAGRQTDQNNEISEVKVYDSSIDDYDATFVLANKILKILGLGLTTSKMSRAKRIFWNTYFWFNFINVGIAGSSEAINMFKMAASGTLFDLFTMLPCVGYVVSAVLKANKIKRYKHVFLNLINEPRTMWPTGRVTEEEHQIIKDALAQIQFFNRVYFLSNLALVWMFLSPPIIIWVKSKTGYDVEPILPFSYWLPYDVKKGNRFEYTFFMQMYHCFITASCMVIGDLLFCIILNHITMQFSLLVYRITKLFYVPIDKQLIEDYPLSKYSKKFILEEEGISFNDEEKEKQLLTELGAIIRRHQALIRLAGDVENMYTFTLLVNFMNSSVVICFCLFCCAFIEKWNDFIYKTFFTTTVMQIWLFCWYGQRLLDTSTGVGEALYNCGWYMASKGFKKSMLIMLRRSQKPVHLTTYGFSKVSLQNFATIMKTSWSYFTLLINVYKE